MKKILASLLTILLLTFAFVSCNLDGTSGIFREIALSKAPLSIRYKQLLGINGTYLYFRTANGVERVTTAKVNTRVATSTFENIIQAAALNGTEVLYITNNETERTGNIVNIVDTTVPSFTKSTITITTTETTSVSSELAIKNLYANSMILVTGKDASDAKVFELLKYDGTNFNTPVAQFTMPSNDYDLENVIQQTAKEQDASAPMLVSFVSYDDNTKVFSRQHYLVDPSGAAPTSLGTLNVKIANFLYKDASNMYVLTTDGNLYHVDSADPPTWTPIGSSSKAYEPNAFALAVDDGTNYHLITKPSTKTAALHVFTFLNTLPNANVGAGVDVKSGYAKELSLATIVSSQVKSISATSTDLLVATDEDGMYDISITHSEANKDIDTNGSTSTAEGYSFP